MLNRIIALIIKELLCLWRDKKSRMVLIIPPIMQILIFSFAATLEINNVAIGIINNDNGIISHRIEDRFNRASVFNGIYHLQSNANNFINMEKGIAVVNFNQDFSKKFFNKETPIIQIIIDGRKSNSAQIVLGYISQIINQYNFELITETNNKFPKSFLITRHWFNPNLENQWFVVPALMAIISLMMSIVVTGLSVARERELGTFDQLLVSPIRPLEILIGKTIPGLLVGITEATFLFIITIFIFHIPFGGSIFLLYISLIIFILSVLGFGLFISSISKTQQQAILGAFIFMVPTVLLSGFTTPIDNMPVWLQPITILNPLKYLIFILRGLFLKDMPIGVILANLMPLIIIAIITFSSVTWFFKRRIE